MVGLHAGDDGKFIVVGIVPPIGPDVVARGLQKYRLVIAAGDTVFGDARLGRDPRAKELEFVQEVRIEPVEHEAAARVVVAAALVPVGRAEKVVSGNAVDVQNR